MNDKSKKLLGFLKDDLQNLFDSIEKNDDLQKVVIKEDGYTLWDFFLYWEKFLPQITTD